MRDPETRGAFPRWARMLLLSFPSDFRERHAQDLMEAYLDTHQEHRGLSLWARVALDALPAGFAARWERRKERAWQRARGRSGSEGGLGSGERRSPGWRGLGEEAARDMRQGLRQAVRAPGFTAAVLGTLAIGIAANTLVFSVMNPFFFRELDYRDGDALVQLGLVDPVSGFESGRLSLQQMEDWSSRSTAFESLSLYGYTGMTMAGADRTESVTVGLMGGGLFAMLGVDPLFGRTLSPDEFGPSAPHVVVLGEALFSRFFGGNPAALGGSVDLDGNPYTIVGVMPASFVFPYGEVGLWTPLTENASSGDRDDAYYLPVGRLAENVTPTMATAQLNGIHADLSRQYPDIDGLASRVSVKPLREALNFVYDELRLSTLALLTAMFLVLMIACTNVASLMLARTASRTREMSVRAALGAHRGRIIRQLLAENVILALGGTLLALGLVYAALAAIGPLVPDALYRVGDFSLDGRVLAFAAVVAVAALATFGLAPAVAASRADVSGALGDARSGGGGRRGLRTRRALVAGQVAMAVMLLAAAGTMTRSALTLLGSGLGFDVDRMAALEVGPPAERYAGSEELDQYFERLRAQVADIPGVTATALTSPLPLNHATYSIEYEVAGAAPPETGRTSADWFAVSPNYREVMNIPLLAGRDFTEADGIDAGRVVLINDAFRRRHWSERSPVGETVLLLGSPGDSVVATIVGVVGNVKSRGLGAVTEAQIYRPLLQHRVQGRHVVARVGAGPSGAVVTALHQAALAIDPELPARAAVSMRTLAAENSLQWSLTGGVLAAFGLVALLLASMGVYGLIAFSVARRSREMGIRIALGASSTDVSRAVVLEAVRLVGVGIGVGVLGAVLAGRGLDALFYGVRGFDPVTLAGVSLVFLCVAVASSLLPARRATRLDPAVTLRAE